MDGFFRPSSTAGRSILILTTILATIPPTSPQKGQIQFFLVFWPASRCLFGPCIFSLVLPLREHRGRNSRCTEFAVARDSLQWASLARNPFFILSVSFFRVIVTVFLLSGTKIFMLFFGLRSLGPATVFLLSQLPCLFFLSFFEVFFAKGPAQEKKGAATADKILSGVRGGHFKRRGEN